MTIQKILVPVDFSEHASDAMALAVDFAKSFGAAIHLLHCYAINPGGISPYGVVLSPQLDQEFRAGAEAKLAEWAEKISGEGVAVTTELTPEMPSQAISTTAKTIGADLIVMGSRGLTGLAHVLLGSVAERTLRLAPCPVLTVKHAEAE